MFMLSYMCVPLKQNILFHYAFWMCHFMAISIYLLHLLSISIYDYQWYSEELGYVAPKINWIDQFFYFSSSSRHNEIITKLIYILLWPREGLGQDVCVYECCKLRDHEICYKILNQLSFLRAYQYVKVFAHS